MLFFSFQLHLSLFFFKPERDRAITDGLGPTPGADLPNDVELGVIRFNIFFKCDFVFLYVTQWYQQRYSKAKEDPPRRSCFELARCKAAQSCKVQGL